MSRDSALTWADYSRAVERTANGGDAARRLANFGMGLAGEAGEVCDALKKHLYHGHALSREALTEELGDVLWYVVALANTLDLPLEAIVRTNIAKLQARYPEGFDPLRSQRRGGGG